MSTCDHLEIEILDSFHTEAGIDVSIELTMLQAADLRGNGISRHLNKGYDHCSVTISNFYIIILVSNSVPHFGQLRVLFPRLVDVLITTLQLGQVLNL